MAMKRITMQDIADACGLSRNTVSKVFNDRGSVPEATRQQVLAKARELGLYMQKYCGCVFSEEDRYAKQIKKDRERFGGVL